jgi:hypothetical protein
MFEVGIMLQFLVLCYGVLGDGMENSTAVLLNVNDGPSLLQISGVYFFSWRPILFYVEYY